MNAPVKISELPTGGTVDGTELIAVVQGGNTVHVRVTDVLATVHTAGTSTASLSLYQRTTTSSPPALPSAAVTYAFGDGSTTGVNNGWLRSVPTAGGAYLWVTSTQAIGTGSTVSLAPSAWAPVALLAQDGGPGGAGANGLNNALVEVYQRSVAVPTLPAAVVTYTFATAAIAGLNNGWQTTIPAGSTPLYVTSAVASSSGATDTIAPNEWASAVVLVSNGTNGNDGAAGLNSATVTLFQRTTTSAAPALPSATVTYAFGSAVATGVNNGWSQSLPTTGGPFRWMTTAAAIATTATDTIAPSEWAVASVLAQNGTDGNNGLNGASAPLLSLTLNSLAFTYDGSNTASPTSQTISVSAILQNLAGTATWACDTYDASGTHIAAVSMGGSGNTRTLTAAQFDVSAYAVISASLSGLSDTQTVVRLRSGTNGTSGVAITAVLSNDSQTLPADASGHVSNYTGATSTLTIYSNGADDSSHWTFSEAASTGVTASLSANTVTVSGLADANDTGYVDITASRSGYSSIVKRFSLAKSKSAPVVAASGVNSQLGAISVSGQTAAPAQAKAGVQFNIDGQIYTLASPATTYVTNGQKWWIGAPSSVPTAGYTLTTNIVSKGTNSAGTNVPGVTAASGALTTGRVVLANINSSTSGTITVNYAITDSSGNTVSQGSIYLAVDSS